MFGMLAVHEEVAEYVIDDERLSELPKDFYATRGYTDLLIDSIRQDRGDGKPFLAYLAFTSPHDPLHVPEPWLSKYRGAYGEVYEVLKAQRAAAAKRMGPIPDSAAMPERYHMIKGWDSLSAEQQALEARGMEVYAGMVDNMDYHYGRVINYLKDIGEYDNTIVIFLSDNGPNPWYSEDYPGNLGSEWYAQFDNRKESIGHPMSHYAYGMGWGSASAGPLDLFKMTIAEGGIRSPLLIAGPDVKGGRQLDEFAYVWDILPAILDLAGISPPEKYQGRTVEKIRGKSLTGLLDGSKQALYSADEFIGGEMQNGKWMRQGDLKAVSVAPPYGDGVWRLFNLADDPGETRDLASVHLQKMKALRMAWDEYAQDVGVVLSK